MERNSENTIYRNILAAFMILIMHVLLLGSIGVLVLFFYGIVNHMAWIVLGVSCLSIGGYWLYRKVRSDANALKNMMGGSLRGRTMEVSFLGGLANLKITDSKTIGGINLIAQKVPEPLPAPGPEDMTALKELAGLYERELITLDEFNRAKQKFLS